MECTREEVETIFLSADVDGSGMLSINYVTTNTLGTGQAGADGVAADGPGAEQATGALRGGQHQRRHSMPRRKNSFLFLKSPLW